MLWKLSSLLLTAVSCWAQWPAPKSAMDAYDYVQARRAEAEKLWGHDDARAVAILNAALAYLDQPLVKDLAAGNRYLAARRSNIYYDFAEAYAQQGNTAEALANLRKFADLFQDPSAAKGIEQNPHFEKLRGEPAYRAILAHQRQFEHFWDSAALKTAFRENLPDSEKLAGLSKFWSEIKYNFGYPEKLVELDWDNVYLSAIPKVLATQSTADYYREMMRLCARLGDGHTNVYPPTDLNNLAKPPMRTGLVDGHVMIFDARSPSLEARDIRAGVEILQVDGVPAVDYARRDVEPYQSASTKQDLENRTFWYGFLRGPSNQSVRLKLRDAAGKEFDRDLERQGYKDTRRILPLEWRMLPQGNIAYVALNDFSSNELVKQWNENLPKISAASAIILDLRLNGGGSSGIGYEVIRSLIDHPVPGSREMMRRYNPTDRARGTLMEWTELPADDLTPSQGPHFSRPVAVLIGPATFSAAEDFLVTWKNSGRGKIIGEPSGGSTGQPLFFQLPGGGSARVCTKRDTFPDGTEWVGKGIQPDVLVKPTLADVRTGRDAVLERAVEILKAAAPATNH
jgi:carboxyl-terminal processing protease